jgi:hypothetical protein
MCADALGRCRREPGANKLGQLRDGEAVRQHNRFGAAVAAGGEQFERAAAVGLGTAAEGSRHLVGGLLGPGGKTTRFPHQVAYS